MDKTDLLDQVLLLLREKKGIDFAGYRRSTLEHSLAERLLQQKCKEPLSYLRQLDKSSSEQDHLLQAFTINYSRLFRNPLVFEILAERVIPEIIERKSHSGNRELRIWSAGCAGGEEPCSVAIIIHQLLAEPGLSWTTHLFATDIDRQALRRADEGRYTRSAFSDTKLGLLDQYFTARGDEFTVRAPIRNMIRYSYNDLTSPDTVAPAESVFGTFDLILCRNVLIYFTKELQLCVFDKIHRSLSRHGYLVLGEAEFISKELQSEFVALDEKLRIYRKAG